MDFSVPEELQMLRQLVHRFVEEELFPLERELGYDATEVPEPHLSRLQQKAKELGIWQMGVPEEYGGAGLSVLAMCIVHEETGKTVLTSTGVRGNIFGFNAPPALYAAATPYQKEKYLLPSIRGEKSSAFALTEPSGGSDPANAIQTTMDKDGDCWVLNGSKIFITGGDHADYVTVYARLRGTKGREGVTCVIVEKDTPGFTTRPVPVIRPCWPAELIFQDCRIPAENVVGEVGQGFSLAQGQLGSARLTYAANCIGIAERAHRMAVEYARQRQTFGRPLMDRQAVQWMIADSEVEIHATRMMLYHAAWKAQQKENFRHEASIIKLYATEMVGRVVDRSIQIHGGLGVSKELPLERFYREVRVKRIGEGPSEVHRMVIARNLLRGFVPLR